MSQPQQPQRVGRRTAVRRNPVNLTTALAVVLPLLSAGAIVLVRPDEPTQDLRPPTETALTAATLICPAALPDSPEVALSTVAEGVDGRVLVGLGDAAADADLVTGRVTGVDDPEALAVSGSDEAAPGLVAARSGGAEQAVTACAPPAAATWFTGVGAGPAHSSVLELTNPDSGTAIADVTVHGLDGVVDAPRLRGVSVPGGTSVALDLAAILPRSDELAIEVVSARGRIGATVLDRVDPIGSRPLTRDWLPGQAEPAMQGLLLGLAPGRGPRLLAISNPGNDEVRVELKVVGTDSVFAPEGVEEIRVSPRSVLRIPVTEILGGEDVLGLAVTASAPVTTTLRSMADGDLSHAVPGVAFSEAATVLLPEAPETGPQKAERQVVLAGATSAGTVTVVARDADGRELSSRELEVTPGIGIAVPVPSAARQVSVVPGRTSMTGAVVTSSKAGAAVLPLTVPVSSGLVPDVRPGLP